MKRILNLLLVIVITAGCASLKKNKSNNFTVEQTKNIMNAENFKPMRVFKINNKRDSLLLRMNIVFQR